MVWNLSIRNNFEIVDQINPKSLFLIEKITILSFWNKPLKKRYSQKQKTKFTIEFCKKSITGCWQNIMKITIEFCISELISFCTKFQLNPKKAGGWRGWMGGWMESIWHPSSPCWVFPEIYFSGREGEALPFCDF